MQTIDNALSLAKPEFLFNPDDGCLYAEGGRFVFALNEDTMELEWGLAL